MGFVIFLLVVVGIIVLVVVVKKNKQKKEKEELKNSNAYGISIKIKEELEKKTGEKFGEPLICYTEKAYGIIYCDFSDRKNSDYRYKINITFSEYEKGVYDARLVFKLQKASEVKDKCRIYGIENEKIGVIVTSKIDIGLASPEESQRLSQEAQEYLKIAAEIIKSNGYGQCSEITQ